MARWRSSSTTADGSSTTGDNRDVVRRISSPIFIGRAEELAALDAALAAARAGTASAVLVSGEAGIGKTRLLAEFAARASAGGTRVLIGNCIELGDGELPHAPLAAILRQLESELASDELDAVLGPARAVLDPAAPENQASQARAGAGDARPPRRARAGRHRDRGPPLGRSLHARPAGVPDPQPAPRADRARRDLPQRRAASPPPPAPVPQRSRRRCRADRAGALRRGRARPAPERDPWRRARPRAGRAAAGALGGQRVPGRGAARRRRGRAARHTARRDDGARRAGVGRRQGGAARRRVRRSDECPTACWRRRRSCRSPSWRTDCARRSPTTSWCAAAAMPTRSGTRWCARSCTRTSCRASAPACMPRSPVRWPARRTLASEGAAVAAAELAHHWKAAHELGAALAASVDAGRAAARIAAFPEAQRHFDYALDVWDRVEDAEARAGMDRIDLTRRAADAAHLVADRERAIALTRDAAARLDAARDPVRAGLVQERLARYLWVVGRDDEAAEALPRGSRDAPGRSAQRRTRARRRGRGPAADAPRAGTSGDTALRGGARRRPRGRRARRGGAGAQHARRVSLRPWRARRGRGLPARGARDRARAAAVARHRSCLREPG